MASLFVKKKHVLQGIVSNKDTLMSTRLSVRTERTVELVTCLSTGHCRLRAVCFEANMEILEMNHQ